MAIVGGGEFADSRVTVNKTELLNIIKKNRDAHVAELEMARKGYREAVAAELKSMLTDAETGGAIRRNVEAVEPSDHVKDYDRVVRMLEMSTSDTVVIDSHQFSSYVMDEWVWSAYAKTANSTYAVRR